MSSHRGIIVYALFCTAIFCEFASPSGYAAEEDRLIDVILAVDKEGKGHKDAVVAVQNLSSYDVEVLPVILVAMNKANPLAMNWLRGSFETIADRAISRGKNLPAKELLAYVMETENSSRARRLAYEWLVVEDAEIAETLIPQMITDPSPEFRREAVARLIESGQALKEKNENDPAIDAFQGALVGATDDDQVKAITAGLKELGVDVDIANHFGFLKNWQLTGPFDNTGKKGFFATYEPEESADLDKTYVGKLGEVTWTELSTSDPYGIVDIAKQIEAYKGAVMYARVEFDSEKDQDVELRLGTPNAWKIWVNNEMLFGREEYHRGMAIDQYNVPAKLTKGTNVILLKLCQNEQSEDWAQRYQYQLRVCNASGIAIHEAADQDNSTSARTTKSKTVVSQK
ncbi:MAG: hypothetical protein O2955_11785 [Planctomycetota bacterium]|nr:hypothetical protein [Planctomycetota bacterium]MDA1213191.1 hypothetical protein [Planctomycetota bacterium]